MSESDLQELIRYRIQRAKETASEVPALIALGFYNTAVNRIYYACYYAVTALLIQKGLFPKTHDGVRQLFGLHFVKSGLVSREFAKYYTDLFDRRQTGDYDDFITYDENFAVELFQPANDFIKEVEAILNQ